MHFRRRTFSFRGVLEDKRGYQQVYTPHIGPLEKIPYMLVIGEKEQTAGTVAIRARTGGDQGAVPIAELIARLEQEVREKRLEG